MKGNISPEEKRIIEQLKKEGINDALEREEKSAERYPWGASVELGYHFEVRVPFNQKVFQRLITGNYTTSYLIDICEAIVAPILPLLKRYAAKLLVCRLSKEEIKELLESPESHLLTREVKRIFLEGFSIEELKEMFKKEMKKLSETGKTLGIGDVIMEILIEKSTDEEIEKLLRGDLPSMGKNLFLIELAYKRKITTLKRLAQKKDLPKETQEKIREAIETAERL